MLAILLPRVIGNITNEQIATLFETYQTDLTCNLDEFKREIARWRTRWSITPRDQVCLPYFFGSLFFFQHADVHATACWRIGSYAPVGYCFITVREPCNNQRPICIMSWLHVKYWKVSLYYAFIDHMIMELESRLLKSENRFYAQYLLPRVIGNITNEQVATLYETYQTDLTCNLDTNFSITLSKSTLKSRWICINASDYNLSLFIVDRQLLGGKPNQTPPPFSRFGCLHCKKG
jgi:hypothetical protein